MTELKIDSRRLIRMGLSSSVLATLPLGCVMLGNDETDELLQFVSNSRSPVDAKRTGSLLQEDFEKLVGLCQYVNRAWELDADMGLYFNRLRVDLDFKTSEEPSYLTEYKHAVELISRMVGATSSVEQAWASLLFSDFEFENFSATKLGRARRLVFSELITHQIPASGAFKSFGLWNYSGYFGGSFTAPESYRKGAV